MADARHERRFKLAGGEFKSFTALLPVDRTMDPLHGLLISLAVIAILLFGCWLELRRIRKAPREESIAHAQQAGSLHHPPYLRCNNCKLIVARYRILGDSEVQCANCEAEAK